MIVVETSVKTIQAEVDLLNRVHADNASLYARGAIDALKWLKDGTPKPSATSFIQSQLDGSAHD